MTSGYKDDLLCGYYKYINDNNDVVQLEKTSRFYSSANVVEITEEEFNILSESFNEESKQESWIL